MFCLLLLFKFCSSFGCCYNSFILFYFISCHYFCCYWFRLNWFRPIYIYVCLFVCLSIWFGRAKDQNKKYIGLYKLIWNAMKNMKYRHRLWLAFNMDNRSQINIFPFDRWSAIHRERESKSGSGYLFIFVLVYDGIFECE